MKIFGYNNSCHNPSSCSNFHHIYIASYYSSMQHGYRYAYGIGRIWIRGYGNFSENRIRGYVLIFFNKINSNAN